MENDLPRRREAEGLSQGELAEALGVTRQTINAIERDRYDPSLELAFKLAAHFECHIEDIFQPEASDDET
jgi:putative transcriptional regulator